MAGELENSTGALEVQAECAQSDRNSSRVLSLAQMQMGCLILDKSVLLWASEPFSLQSWSEWCSSIENSDFILGSMGKAPEVLELGGW